MQRILLMIDDNFSRVQELRAVLNQENIEVLHAFGIQDASRLITKQDLSIVALQFTPLNAIFQFLSDLRTARPMPIVLMDTTDGDERTRAYQIGADLCLDAPVQIAELTAGIYALLRRYYKLNRVAQLREVGMSIHHKELTLDPQCRRVTMRGETVELLPKEFDVLYFLIRHPGIVFSREQIYEHVWREEHPYGSRSVLDHISAIRKKLGLPARDKEYIETINHVGYRMAP